MAEYIEREALIDFLEHHQRDTKYLRAYHSYRYMDFVIDDIKQFPATKITHCGECENWGDCRLSHWMGEDGYCSEGTERYVVDY